VPIGARSLLSFSCVILASNGPSLHFTVAYETTITNTTTYTYGELTGEANVSLTRHQSRRMWLWSALATRLRMLVGWRW
jgi:hypothetical protein